MTSISALACLVSLADIPTFRQVYNSRSFLAETGKLLAQYRGTTSHRAGDDLMIILNGRIPIGDPALSAVQLGLALLQRVTERCREREVMGYDRGIGVGLSLG